MNFGDCPYDECTGKFWEAIPDRTPAWAKLTCETCGRPVWYKFSRIDPEAYTLEAFEAEFIVDEATKSIRERNPKPPLAPPVQAAVDSMLRQHVKRTEHVMLFGMGHYCPECLPSDSELAEVLLSAFATAEEHQA